MNGRLIVIEGLNGRECSLHARMLAGWLDSDAHAVRPVRMSRSSIRQQLGPRIGLSAETMLLADLSSMAGAIERTIVPHLKAGVSVCVDQYLMRAFVGALIRGVPKRAVRKALEGFPKADLTFYLQLPLEAACFEGDRYDVGEDLELSRSADENRRLFLGRLVEEMDGAARAQDAHAIDGQQSLDYQQTSMRETAAKLLTEPRRKRER